MDEQVVASGFEKKRRKIYPSYIIANPIKFFIITILALILFLLGLLIKDFVSTSGHITINPLDTHHAIKQNAESVLDKKHINTPQGFVLELPEDWTLADERNSVLIVKAPLFDSDTPTVISISTNSGSLNPPIERMKGETFISWVKRFSGADTSFSKGTKMTFFSEFKEISGGEVLEKRAVYNSEFGPGPNFSYYLYLSTNDSKIKNYILMGSEEDKYLLDVVKGFIKSPRPN